MKPNPSRNWSIAFYGECDQFHSATFVGTLDEALARADEEECEFEWQALRVSILAQGGSNAR